MTEVIRIEILNHLFFCMFDKTCICVVNYNVNNLNIASYWLSLRSSSLWLGNIASTKQTFMKHLFIRLVRTAWTLITQVNRHGIVVISPEKLCDYRHKKVRKENIARYYQPCCISRHFLSTKLLTIRYVSRVSRTRCSVKFDANLLLQMPKCKP